MITRIILFYIISNSFVFSQTPKAELYLQAFRDLNADYPSIAYDIDHIKQNYFSYSYNNSKFYHDVRIIKLSDEKEVSVQTTNYCDDYCFNKNIQFWELNANKLKNITKDILSIEYDTVVFKKVSLEIKKLSFNIKILL